MRRSAALLVVVALLFGSCGSTTAADQALPFDAVLVDLFGTDDIEAYRAETTRLANELLIDCMANAGFEFVIPDPGPARPTDAELESADFIAAQGFGIIARFRSWVDTLDFESYGRDLNREYLGTLRGAEIERYFMVLEGEPAEPGQIQQAPGCRGTAAGDAWADWGRFYDALPNYTAMAEERDTHPDWLAARAEWRECMSTRGWDQAEPEAIRSDIERQLQEIVSERYPDGRLPLVPEGGGYVLESGVEALLDELQDLEIDAATANRECSEPVEDALRAVEREVQQGFVDRNRVTIEALLASPQ